MISVILSRSYPPYITCIHRISSLHDTAIGHMHPPYQCDRQYSLQFLFWSKSTDPEILHTFEINIVIIGNSMQFYLRTFYIPSTSVFSVINTLPLANCTPTTQNAKMIKNFIIKSRILYKRSV